MEESLWRREGGEVGIFGMSGGGGLGGGGNWRWFLIRGFGGDSRGVYGLIVLLAEVFSFFFFFHDM